MVGDLSNMWAVPAGPQSVAGPYDAAHLFDQSLAKWLPQLRSADSDLLPGKPLIDVRSRDIARNDAYVQGGANLHKDNIVGAHYLLNSRPATKVIFGKDDPVWEEEFQEEVEELWDLYASSPNHWVDASRQADFTTLVRMAVGTHVLAGEVLATCEWITGDASEYNTAIQMVDLDRLSTDPSSGFNPYNRAGVIFNQQGAPQAYQIRTTHPFDYPFLQTQAPSWNTVALKKPWGRLQVIHLYEKIRPQQTRGVTELASALKEMRMTHKFRDVNLQRAVLQSLYAAVITSDLDSSTLFAQLGEGHSNLEDFEHLFNQYAAGYMSSVNAYAGKAGRMKLDGVRIPHLYPGTKLELMSAGDSAQTNQGFEASLLRYMAAALGVSYEQLSRDYTSTNYSSARAAMAETWKFMSARKKLIADRFASAIFRLWIEEAVNKNMLTTFPASKAPMLYTNGVQNRKFEALAGCEWIGASKGQIDELKETQAATMRLNAGLSTAQDELARLGKDWRKTYRQIKREKDMQEQLGLVFTATGTLPRGGAAPISEVGGPDLSVAQPAPEDAAHSAPGDAADSEETGDA